MAYKVGPLGDREVEIKVTPLRNLAIPISP